MALLAAKVVADHAEPRTRCRCSGPALGSAIPKRRPCCSDGTVFRAVSTLRGIDLGEEHAGLDAALGKNLAPGGDDQRMAVGLALVLVHAALRRGEDEAAGLDGAGAQQRVPMRLAGLSGEGRRHREERRAGFGQRAIERRKTHVVADRQPDAAPRQVRDHGGLARLVVGGLAIALAAGQIDIEHMDLVVAGEQIAVGPDQERAVDRALRRKAQRQRADMEMDLQFRGERAIGFQREIVFLGGQMLEQRLAVQLHHVAHLGGEHIIGALRRRLADQLDALLEARLGQQPGAHLHHGGGKGRASAHEEAFSPASRPSSLPARSSA